MTIRKISLLLDSIYHLPTIIHHLHFYYIHYVQSQHKINMFGPHVSPQEMTDCPNSVFQQPLDMDEQINKSHENTLKSTRNGLSQVIVVCRRRSSGSHILKDVNKCDIELELDKIAVLNLPEIKYLYMPFYIKYQIIK